MFSFGGSDTAIGLSIGTSSIKIVELAKSRKGWKLLHFGMIQLPDESIVNREIVNPIGVVESIKTLTHQLHLKSKRVCTSLSGASVIVKRMQVEVQSMREIQEQVFWEAEQYLPFDVTEVVMDFQVISKSKDNKADVILVAVKKTILESYMQCVEDAGLKPAVVDVDFFALQNVYEANYPQQSSDAVAIVDIGASSTKLVVVQNGVPVFTKDSVLGGRNLTLDIQKHLNLSIADAETLKVGGGQGGAFPQEVSELMHIASENLASEIKRGLDFYAASSSGAPVRYIILAGGGAKVPRLSQTIEELLSMPTQLINCFNGIPYDPSIFSQEYLNAISPLAAVPIGLALRAGLK